jgi:glycosyltransferase involved in cell wall biosynthesis
MSTHSDRNHADARPEAPLVSVVMLVYNREQYLEAAIRSILCQSFTGYEFIIVNDGSTDNSAAVVRQFTDDRIRFYDFSRNAGIIERRNFALSQARGKYMAVMDSDDIAGRERLERQVSFLERNPAYGMCGTYIGFIDPEGRPWPMRGSWVNESQHERIMAKMLFYCNICQPSTLIRRNVLVEHGISYDSRYPDAEDYKLWVDLGRVAKLANIPIPLHQYRVHPRQNSQVQSEVLVSSTARVVTDQLRDLGIAPTERQLYLHFRLGRPFDFPTPPNGEELDEIAAWVEKLKQHNLQYRAYDQAALHSLLDEAFAELAAAQCPAGVVPAC